MAYRGSSSRSNSSNTKRPLTPTDAFDSKFTDFGGGNSSTSSSSKRQRTNTGGNAKPARISPLKFDNGNQTTKIVGPVLEPKKTPPVTNKAVFKPIPPSQKARESNVQPSPNDDWGDIDDDDNDLFIAASQAAEDESHHREDKTVNANDEVLAAMSALLEDDDDFDIEPVNVPDRLNSTLVSFDLGHQKPVFKEPAPLPTKDELHGEEIERLKKQQTKVQGEASMLRGELNKQSKEFNLERLNLRRTETDLREKIKEQQKTLDDETSRAKTEKLFLLQEMQQLRDQLTKMNADKKLRESQMTHEVHTKKRKVLDDIKTDRNSFPSSKDFSKYVSTKSSETQTFASRRRSCTLKPIDKVRNSALVFSQTVKASDSINTALLQMDSSSYHQVVPKLVFNQFEELKNENDELPSSAQLNIIHDILCFWGETLTNDDRVHVTETCSKLIRKMIRSRDYTLLLLVLKIILTIWKRKMMDIDITNDIMEVLVQTFESKVLRDVFDTDFINVIFDLLCLVTLERDQTKVICSSSDNCLLTSVMKMIYINTQMLKEGQRRKDALKQGFRALSWWLQQSLTVSHQLPWISFQCQECSSEVTRCYVFFTQSQVNRYVTHNDSDSDLIASLNKCVQILSWLQSRFAKIGNVGWAKVFGDDATTARQYIWSVERLQTKGMDPYVSQLLNNLSIEVAEKS